MIDINVLIQKAQRAVMFVEDADARRLIGEIRELTASQNIQQTDQQLFGQLQKLIVQLGVVAFSNLSDDESVEILRSHYLESFDIEVPMGGRIEAKLFLVPYLVRDELRRKLKAALQENSQRIGSLTIGQWIQKFEKAFSVDTRDKSSVVRFVLQSPDARTLNSIEQRKLKDVLHTYDYYLVSTLPATGEDLEKMLNSASNQSFVASDRPMRSNVSGGGQRMGAGTSNRSGAPMAKVQMTLQEALKKFEKLGEQHLSANPIKLKIFDAPVRPSIKNWISDYYEKVDARKHDSIERGNYLFHSENARRLTTGERQKVGTMLKALDEDGVVTVDQGKQELIFQGETLETENTNHKEQITNKTQNTSTSQNTNNHGGVSFSSGHKFPYEQKTNAQAPAEQRQPLRPAMNRPQYDNLGFTPPRRQDSRPSNNVVDLRND